MEHDLTTPHTLFLLLPIKKKSSYLKSFSAHWTFSTHYPNVCQKKKTGYSNLSKWHVKMQMKGSIEQSTLKWGKKAAVRCGNSLYVCAKQKISVAYFFLFICYLLANAQIVVVFSVSHLHFSHSSTHVVCCSIQCLSLSAPNKKKQTSFFFIEKTWMGGVQ